MGELTKLYGSSFTTVSGDPSAGEQPRRKWVPITSGASTKQQRSQEEQRIVDVTLRDVLARTYDLPPAAKAGWADLADALTLVPDRWEVVTDRIKSIAGPHDEQSGYFWSSMLTATAGAGLRRGPGGSSAPPSAAAIVGVAMRRGGTYHRVQTPRARSGNRLQAINELSFPSVIDLAAEEVHRALLVTGLPPAHARHVVMLVGATVSADLWHHPAAVRGTLIPS
ncbi:hypothetical protein [Luteipulveratus halotolerans]|uniref:Uncharacterized protein n=1 Tax=Luteipulveratus halotolerans TaxID=1631356 RepID=A0A0L6CDI3_9MICO|nr:hypothetical protein [Luteipulveratus halotolerans]KNX35877.1 hypothetical protein VV01_21645 [Luteipulveratus halotolerans]